MNHNLAEYIKRYVNLTEEQLEIFNSYLRPKTIAKKEFILEEGQVCKARYYIKKGCIRMYYIDQKANEQIIHFAVDNWWLTDYESLTSKEASKFYIQTTEDTEILELPESNFDELCSKLPQTDRLFRKIMEKSFIACQKRMQYTFSLSGEDLYHHFLNSNVAFAQRVPQYMITSYLGMSPEFVSKVKHKKGRS
ncbi:MAG: Crp/Fnr family transcriptional regulator [Flavobacteriales bacterium]